MCVFVSFLIALEFTSNLSLAVVLFIFASGIWSKDETKWLHRSPVWRLCFATRGVLADGDGYDGASIALTKDQLT